MISMPDFKSIALPVFDTALDPLGLIRRSAMTWIEPTSSQDGIRRMFSLSQYKGAVVMPEWGYSLDFVPHISGNSVKWHRTAKSAIFDLFITADPKLELNLLQDEVRIRRDLPRVLSASLKAAADFWSPPPTLNDLPSVFEHVRETRKESRWLPAENCTQFTPGYIFTLTKLGQMDKACDMLETWLSLSAGNINASCAKRLRELLEAAQ